MIWLVMIACGLLTFATRFVMFSGLAPRRLPDWLEMRTDSFPSRC